MVERIERRVIEILQSKVVKSGNPKVSIFQIFGYAAIIHIYMFMRDIPRGLPFFIEFDLFRPDRFPGSQAAAIARPPLTRRPANRKAPGHRWCFHSGL